MAYRDYGTHGFENYNNAYITEQKIKIDMDKYAQDLFNWKQQNVNTYNRYDTYPTQTKPQIEDYLVVMGAPSTQVAKSSLSGK